MSSIYEDGFTAQCYDILPDHWQKTSGSAAGVLHPSAMAKDYLGLDPSLGSTALYCLRRFGPPNALHDNDKSIAQWIVTTPMDGVWLGIILSGGSRFRYTVTREIDLAIMGEQYAPMVERGLAFREWAKKERGVVLYGPFTFYGQCTDVETDELFNAWGRQNFKHWDKCNDWAELLETLSLPDGYDRVTEERRLDRLFYDEQKAIAERLHSEYAAEVGEMPQLSISMLGHPYYEAGRAEYFLWSIRLRLRKMKFEALARPFEWMRRMVRDKRRAEFYAEPFWLSLPENSIERQANAAIYRTLQDLLRPVCVRDWDLNIVETHPDGLGDWGVDYE